ncbi:MAG: universal stress protein [Ectothiorhodospiraceae bacterium]|nr:universal stress protein [Chromatiales bacterium]MCP5153734.1 universal stress protein [Ectothiorhodospiraceae bacterium]
MYERILVGLDGSVHGLEATRQAAAIAARFGSELHLVTVTRPYRVNAQLRRFLEAENLLGEPKYVMDQMTTKIVHEARVLAAEAGITALRTAVREGKPARTLVDYAHANHIDLMVVGSRGVGEVGSALLGSVSQKVSMLADCSVLVVRE